MAFAENLKKIREAKGFSQKKLADLVGISQPTIAQYETCLKVPTIVTGVIIAKVLETTCEELVRD